MTDISVSTLHLLHDGTTTLFTHDGRLYEVDYVERLDEPDTPWAATRVDPAIRPGFAVAARAHITPHVRGRTVDITVYESFTLSDYRVAGSEVDTVLADVLRLAVPMHADDLRRNASPREIRQFAVDAATHLAFEDACRGENFTQLARGLAALALTRSGGVTYAGAHFCSGPHDDCPDAAVGEQ